MDQQIKGICKTHCTCTILMIEPIAFDYNAETATNNYFQKRENSEKSEIQQKALEEFLAMKKLLEQEKINVISIKDTLYPHTPDSIFPNNWISFHFNNHVIFYPMFAENRRLERRMDVLLEIEKRLDKKFHYTDYSVFEEENKFLEGTGSLVLDRFHRVAYAAISPRTNEELVKKFCEEMDFEPVLFHATQTVGSEQKPIYHTNVMLCVADKYAVVCLDSVKNSEERNNLIEKLRQTEKEIIEISEEQMEHFAGNMLQLHNTEKEKLCVMSHVAHDSLTEKQIKTLEKYNRLIVIPIPTIEKNGGGSVRCMIAEVF